MYKRNKCIRESPVSYVIKFLRLRNYLKYPSPFPKKDYLAVIPCSGCQYLFSKC